MVWTCVESEQSLGHEKYITDDSRGKAKSRQTKAEIARPGERGYGQKPDDNWDSRRDKTLTCHDSSRPTTKCRDGNVRR